MRSLLLAALLAPTAALAQTRPAVEPPFKAVTGALVALSVSNLDSSTTWYREKLGLRLTMHVPKTATANGIAILEGNGLLLEIQEHSGAAPPDRAPNARQGIFKVGIYVDDLDATLATLRARGVNPAIGPFPKRNDQPANFIIRDNVGNYLQFLER